MRTVYTRVRRAMTPPMEDHRPALRVALGLAVPGIALLAALIALSAALVFARLRPDRL